MQAGATKFADIGARLGIEQRRVELAERMGGLVVELLRGVLAEAELTPTQHAVVAQSIPIRLRALTTALAGEAS